MMESGFHTAAPLARRHTRSDGSRFRDPPQSAPLGGEAGDPELAPQRGATTSSGPRLFSIIAVEFPLETLFTPNQLALRIASSQASRRPSVLLSLRLFESPPPPSLEIPRHIFLHRRDGHQPQVRRL